ncbi:hypothetical protein VTN02DRAFT_6208 [Thermoascus thermophilus]
MAYVKTDAELMTNLIAAKPVPTGSHFAAALDESSRPMVVSLSDDKVPKLQIIRHSPDGRQYLFDLGGCFDLPEGAIIQAFDLVQDASQKLFLAFAYVKDEKSSHVVLAKPFSPSKLQEGVKLSKVPGDWTVGSVKRIFMSPMPSAGQSSASYPLVLLAHANLDQSTSWGDDLTQILTEDNAMGWRVSRSLSTPVNTAGIIDLAPATNFHGQGLFVLYKTSAGESRIYGEFIKPDDQSSDGNVFHFATEVTCPKGATSIATIKDSKKASALIIGSPDGLNYLGSAEAVDRNSQTRLISADDKVHGCKSLKVAQDGEDLSIWFTSNKYELGYIRTTARDAAASNNLPKPVLLLPEGRATSFAPLITGPSPSDPLGQPIWQRIVSNDSFGNLTLLEQGSDRGLWRRKPFYSNDDSSLYHVKSYSMTIKAYDASGSPVKDGSIQVSSASAVTGLLNGGAVTLTAVGDWYKADGQGTLNFIIPAESIASQALTITGLQDSQGGTLQIEKVVFDPASKPLAKLGSTLESLQSGSDLKNLKTQTGKPLFDSSNMPSDEDLSHGVECLKTLHAAYTDLPSDGSAVSGASVLSASATPYGFMDWAMDAWHWITEKIHEAVDWFVETAGKVWKFVCKIAGEVYEFVLDCVEKIGEALTWIWNKLKVAWETLIEFLGFIFNWGDIVQTKDQFSALITAGFNLARNKMGGAADGVNQYFDGLLAKIDGLEIKKDVNVSPKSGSGYSKPSLIQDSEHGTALNWTSERMKNGGIQTSQAVKEDNNPKDDAQKTWDDIFTPALDDIQDAFTQVGNDIKDLWHKHGSISASDFMTLCKDLLKTAVTTVQKLVVALIESLEKLLQLVVEYGNEKITIPIFSTLYKWIVGHDLTAFDAISLIIAIPATILTKIITGSRPPHIENLDANLLSALVFGDSPGSVEVTPQMQLDFNTLTTSFAVSATLVSTVVDLIKFLLALADEGTAGAFKTITKSRFMEYLSIIIDMVTAIGAIPSNPSIPGFEERNWISYLSLIRGGSHILASFVPAKADTAKEKALLVLDLAVTLVNFGLYQAVGAAEIGAASTWPDYDLDSTVVGIEGSVLNAVSGVGYFVAFMFKENIEVSGVGLAVLEGAAVALAAVDAIKWKIDYDRKVRSYLRPLAA